MFCIKCGNENSENNKFCIKCGAKLEPVASNDDGDNKSHSHVDNSASPWGNEQSPSATTVIDQNTDFSDKNTVGDVSDTPNDDSTTVLKQSFVVLTRKNDDKEYIIDNLPATIGKGSAADFVIAGDNAISRVHVKIHEYGDEGFVIEDLNSTNKTFLNGNALEPEELVVINNGDILKLGKTEFKIVI